MVTLFPFGHRDEITLHLVDDGRNRREKRGDHFFVTMPRVYWFTGFTHDEEVLSDLVELLEFFSDGHVLLERGVDLLALEKCLNFLLFCQMVLFGLLLRYLLLLCRHVMRTCGFCLLRGRRRFFGHRVLYLRDAISGLICHGRLHLYLLLKLL